MSPGPLGSLSAPRPYAEILGTEVVLGYGTPEAPALECEPTALDAA
jgi:hypothetical protein